jgi:hypothetical protein
MPKAYKALPPASELWELFDYKPLTGELVWNNHPRYKTWKGRTVGVVDKKYGYQIVNCFANRYKAHRVVWTWVTGSVLSTDQKLDHIDRNKLNNRFDNLRTVSDSQNAANRKRTTRSGCHRITSRKLAKPWMSQIRVEGQYVFLGYFATKAEGNAAYEKANAAIHGEFSPYTDYIGETVSK